MMNHDTFTEKISLWLDDQLSATEMTELQQHLTDCSSCRETYRAMQHVDHLLRTAATRMAAPNPGFVPRFEGRLSHHQNRKPWHAWLSIAALLLGTFSIFGVLLVSQGLPLLGIGSYLLDAQVLYQWLTTFIESVAGLQFVINFGLLLLKTVYIIMGQPIFWGLVITALFMIGLWGWLIRTLAQRTVMPSQLMI